LAIRFDDRVAIVTGAGGGLGREYALALAARGAKVLVNDFGGSRDGTGGSRTMAEAVVAEIEAAGGEALANDANVADFDQVQAMVDAARSRWNRVDILVNNAGILRDKTFAKMDMADFRTVLDVHLIGSANCTKAAWALMREQAYGRVVMTSSSTGLYGNFGQANYAAAKMGLVGLMNTLALEGARYDIRINSIAPIAATRLTNDLGWNEETSSRLSPQTVVPAVLFLCSEVAPNKAIVNAGGGGFERTYVTLTQGIHLADDDMTAEAIAASWEDISDRTGEVVPQSGEAQGTVALGRRTRG
jgi:NAD(P)-dependent dehydrogenase (short-subunit alcohol dehydrogenase family)